MTNTTVAAANNYMIPEVPPLGWLKILWPLLLLPGPAALFGLTLSVKFALELASMAAVIAVPVMIVNCFIVIGRQSSRQRAIWTKHDYSWYRSTFPGHAHDKGKVSCRHCQNPHIQVRNLMNRSFMRAHLCNQCGKSLYFSPEHG
jgi:hypothetical protein